ncbi:MAG: hypothetical protein M3245_04450, partial [Actinomycetota bacterium]|nr:hypothetical protein [Actinomycetota bacterium]
VFVATSTNVFNEVFMWGPRDVRREGPRVLRNVVAQNKKVPLTAIEEQIQITNGPSTGPDAIENVEPFHLPSTGARISFATSLPAFFFGELPPRTNPCSNTSKWYMRCLDRLGANLVMQDEANSGEWGTYTDPNSPDRGAWQPLSFMSSLWRHVADRAVRFSYNVTPYMVGNLADLPFDGQTSISQRGLGSSPVRISAARRRCNHVGASRFVPGKDPERFQIGGEDMGVRQFAGPKSEFLALAPWVVRDGPRDGLERVSDELGPDGNGDRENDYVETAVIADLPFPPNPRRASCAAGPLRGLPAIRLSVSPRRVRTGQWRRFSFRATAVVFGERREVSGALIRFGGKRTHTDRRGRAAMTVRFGTPGRKRATASRRGFRSGSATIQAVGRRGRARPRFTG